MMIMMMMMMIMMFLLPGNIPSGYPPRYPGPCQLLQRKVQDYKNFIKVDQMIDHRIKIENKSKNFLKRGRCVTLTFQVGRLQHLQTQQWWTLGQTAEENQNLCIGSICGEKRFPWRVDSATRKDCLMYMTRYCNSVLSWLLFMPMRYYIISTTNIIWLYLLSDYHSFMTFIKGQRLV